MVWFPSPDTKFTRLALTSYCIISTYFNFYYIHRQNLLLQSQGQCTTLLEQATQLPSTSEPLLKPVSSPPSPPASAPGSAHFDVEFPRKIFQTAPSAPALLSTGDWSVIQTWTDLNPHHRYEILTHNTAESYIAEKFAHDPSILETFSKIQDRILRADMIRYIVLAGDGGVYSDLDTKSLQPIEKWVPKEYRDKANVLVGIEYDKLDGQRWLDWTLDLQFCTWAIMAKPSHPLLLKTVKHGISQINELAQKHGTGIADLKVSFLEVLDTTGPAAFTRSVFAYLSERLQEEYTWLNLTGLQAPILIADVLILPINAFGSGQQHSNSRKPTDADAMVEHLFRGSWKHNHDFPEYQPAKAVAAVTSSDDDDEAEVNSTILLDQSPPPELT